MKKYLVYDAIDGQYERFETIEEAEKYLNEIAVDSDNGVDQAISDCLIYKLEKKVEVVVVDKKSNYQYIYQEEVPEGSDEDCWEDNCSDPEFDTVVEVKIVDANV